jgi:hypothetical protein
VGHFTSTSFPIIDHAVIPRCVRAAVDKAALHKHVVRKNKTVPWFMLLVCVFSPPRLGFFSGVRHMGFMVDEVALDTFFWASRIFPAKFHSRAVHPSKESYQPSIRFIISEWILPVTAAERSKAWSILAPLEHWDRVFESHSGHGCVRVYSVFVLTCVTRPRRPTYCL